jgi:hypothetical protein
VTHIMSTDGMCPLAAAGGRASMPKCGLKALSLEGSWEHSLLVVCFA